MRYKCAVLTLVSCFVLSGCALDPIRPLEMFLQDRDLIPYKLATDNPKLGAIVLYPEEQQSIFEVAAAAECFDEPTIARFATREPEALLLPTAEDNRTSSFGLPNVLVSELLKKVSLDESAVRSARIRDVNITIRDSTLTGYTGNSMVDAVMALGDSCKKYAADPDMYIIYQEVTAGSISYIFRDERGALVRLKSTGEKSDDGVPVLSVTSTDEVEPETDKEATTPPDMLTLLDGADGIFLSRSRTGTLVSKTPTIVAHKALQLHALMKGDFKFKRINYRSVSIAESGVDW